MASKRVKLKPCPFCGGEAAYSTYWSGGKEWHLINCKNDCPMTVYVSRLNPDEAITMWNHRACDGDKGHWVYDPSTYKGSVNGIEREGTWRLVRAE
ncbi:MAG: Lar family restriction alleviation protein [Bacteroidales bacterium]|nr:Lar family restriction alleviation protein [Bacteroidales bacterium]